MSAQEGIMLIVLFGIPAIFMVAYTEMAEDGGDAITAIFIYSVTFSLPILGWWFAAEIIKESQ